MDNKQKLTKLKRELNDMFLLLKQYDSLEDLSANYLFLQMKEKDSDICQVLADIYNNDM
jgi:hypothetical protein